MYASSNFRSYSPKTTLSKARSTDNFYKRATQHTIKYQSTNQSTDQCLACKHEKEKTMGGTMKSPLKTTNIYTARKGSGNDYYKTNDKEELNHLKKAKRYLQQLLDRAKDDLKNTTHIYEKKVEELTEQIKQKDKKLYELQRIQNQKEAEQYYLSNASLVQTYQKVGKKAEQQQGMKNRRLKDLMERKDELEDQLQNMYKLAAERQTKLQTLELQIVQMKQNEVNALEYESMKMLIGKMEEEKLQLLDRQHQQLQEVQNRNQEQINCMQDKLQDLSRSLQFKGALLSSRQAELQELKNNIARYKDQQFQALRQLLDQRQKQCLSLESRLNCIESELNFVKGRYGYVLRLAQQGQLMESRINEPQQFCIERVGRYQLSNGKDSLLGMNLSPIKRR